MDSINNVIKFGLHHFTIHTLTSFHLCEYKCPTQSLQLSPRQLFSTKDSDQTHINVSEVENRYSALLARPTARHDRSHSAKIRHIVKALKKHHGHAPIHKHTVWVGTGRSVYASVGLIAGEVTGDMWPAQHFLQITKP